MYDAMKVTKAFAEVQQELQRASEKFPAFHSTHEGHSVILEELEELWDGVKKNDYKDHLRAEAKQVAAMAIRFMVDLT